MVLANCATKCFRSYRGCSAEEYLANLNEVFTFSTVEGFWSVYYNIPTVNKLSPSYAYHMMRGTRRPMWEDKENIYGGAWKFKVDKKDTVSLSSVFVDKIINQVYRNRINSAYKGKGVLI